MQVHGVLESIIIKHKVRLVIDSSGKCYSPSGSRRVTSYICHRGGRVGRKRHDHRRLRTSKKCGCPFKVIIRSWPAGMDNVAIIMQGSHKGHVSGSQSDLYNLQVHPIAIKRCMEDLFDVGTCRHVAKISVSKEQFHICMASPIDQMIYRFFMIPKEILNCGALCWL